MRIIFLALINWIANILTILIIVDTILAWVLSPYHPVREMLGRVLQPLYAPIRRVIPPLGVMDLTPLVLILLIQVIQQVAVSLLR
jgi:YggT family protein